MLAGKTIRGRDCLKKVCQYCYNRSYHIDVDSILDEVKSIIWYNMRAGKPRPYARFLWSRLPLYLFKLYTGLNRRNSYNYREIKMLFNARCIILDELSIYSSNQLIILRRFLPTSSICNSASCLRSARRTG